MKILVTTDNGRVLARIDAPDVLMPGEGTRVQRDAQAQGLGAEMIGVLRQCKPLLTETEAT